MSHYFNQWESPPAGPPFQRTTRHFLNPFNLTPPTQDPRQCGQSAQQQNSCYNGTKFEFAAAAPIASMYYQASCASSQRLHQKNKNKMIRSSLLLVVAAAISGAEAFAPVSMARANTQLFMVSYSDLFFNINRYDFKAQVECGKDSEDSLGSHLLLHNYGQDTALNMQNVEAKLNACVVLRSTTSILWNLARQGLCHQYGGA